MPWRALAVCTALCLPEAGCSSRQTPVRQSPGASLPTAVGGSLSPQGVNGFSEGLARVELNGRHGFIDRNGQVAISPQFARAQSFCDGMALIWDGGRCGWIDKNGKIAIEAAYPEARDFREGLAAVRVGQRWGFIDLSGKMAIEPEYEAADVGFFEGLAGVQVNGRWGFIDKQGKLVIPARYDDAQHFAGTGLAPVLEGTLWGYIDRTGTFVIEPQFVSATTFFGDPPIAFAAAHPIGRGPIGCIDASGRWVFRSPPGVQCGPFTEGLCVGYTFVGAQWLGGYLDIGGRWTVSPRFEWAGAFSEGLANVRLPGGSVGYIDKTGAIVIRPQFAEGQRFSEGRARVRIGNSCGYIDRTGKWIWTPTK